MGLLEFVTCVICGTAMACRKSSGKKYCSKACKAEAVKRNRPAYPYKCANPACKVPFTTSRKAKRYCSLTCKKEHEAAQYKESMELELRSCAYEDCGSTFMANKKQKYCCKEHAAFQKRLNDRRRNATA